MIGYAYLTLGFIALGVVVAVGTWWVALSMAVMY